ncbi:MFS transporter [Thalassospira marina]|uniref:MFS transporter n=1 Tax=Thalassospira marina TaxID=2048283 RepID=A0ABN5FHC5_9PROT|nr:MFS transporter [Thalassospira marina]AUG53808.1 MFS transporter [Thalassospira marina]
MTPAFMLGATGFALIAVCYGFARFAFGLFLPQIDADLSLSASLSGLISGGSFLGYCIAIIISAFATEKFGPRRVAMAAAIVAALGMAGIALAPSPVWLAVSVLLAGSSTGLASPPMAAAVAKIIRPARQGAMNTIINAGTSAGVVLSGPVALALGGEWRFAFAGFAICALFLVFAALVTLPGHGDGGNHACESTPADASTDGASGLPRLNGDLMRLIAATFLTGAASTAIWSFGSKLVKLRLDWGHSGAGMLWIAIGAAGIAGALAGTLVARFGLDRIHRLFLAAIALGIVLVGASFTVPVLAVAGGVLFGAAYIMLTGVYLVWGIRALPDRPATGLMTGFLTLAVGQTAGAPIFGLLMDYISADCAVLVFAILAMVAGALQAGKRNFQPA